MNVETATAPSAIDRAVAVLPDGYSLQIRCGRDWGWVMVEPPTRPGNRGPRLPRWVEGFGERYLGTATLDEALERIITQVTA